jgi:FMN reductase
VPERPERVDVLFVGGSPGLTSRSTSVLAHLGDRLSARGIGVSHWTIRDFPAQELLFGQTDHPVIAVS